MAEACTCTEQVHGKIAKITWAWTSSAAGNVTATETATIVRTTTFAYNGPIVELVTNPGATAPTDNYDVVVLDNTSLDVLAGTGANRHTTTTQYVVASLGYVSDSKLTLEVSSAGDSKIGEVYVYIDQSLREI